MNLSDTLAAALNECLAGQVPKKLGVAVSGGSDSLALMLNQVANGKCTVEQVVKWMCSRPAEIWKMKNKGRIEVGCDADLVLADLNLSLPVKNENQETKCGWTPWHGETLTGWPVATWVMGHQAFERVDGKVSFNDTALGSEIEYSTS